MFNIHLNCSQAILMGKFGTSGASHMDYFITDKIASPLRHSFAYSEKLAYMSDSFCVGNHLQTNVKKMVKTVQNRGKLSFDCCSQYR